MNLTNKQSFTYLEKIIDTIEESVSIKIINTLNIKFSYMYNNLYTIEKQILSNLKYET